MESLTIPVNQPEIAKLKYLYKNDKNKLPTQFTTLFQTHKLIPKTKDSVLEEIRELYQEYVKIWKQEKENVETKYNFKQHCREEYNQKFVNQMNGNDVFRMRVLCEHMKRMGEELETTNKLVINFQKDMIANPDPWKEGYHSKLMNDLEEKQKEFDFSKKMLGDFMSDMVLHYRQLNLAFVDEIYHEQLQKAYEESKIKWEDRYISYRKEHDALNVPGQKFTDAQAVLDFEDIEKYYLLYQDAFMRMKYLLVVINELRHLISIHPVDSSLEDGLHRAEDARSRADANFNIHFSNYQKAQKNFQREQGSADPMNAYKEAIERLGRTETPAMQANAGAWHCLLRLSQMLEQI